MTDAASRAVSDISMLGRRLLPTLIDERAISSPEEISTAVLRPPDVKDGYRGITYRYFSATVNQCSWWLDRSLGNGQT